MSQNVVTTLVCCFSYLMVNAQTRIEFTPTTYSSNFSSRLPSVLRIRQGDTIHTSSVDAGGFDKNGISVAKRGNPLTGPFYVEGANPGDILAVTITGVTLNRNYATTLNTLIPKLLPKKTAKKTWRTAKLLRWKLDLDKMQATPADTMNLGNLYVPLHPFLGCVGVAPAGNDEIPTGASGPYGGNLDFQANTTGSTIYLPVFHAGALLFMGDGHAVQGDGELNGDALETSMDFSFTTRVLPAINFPLQTPMVENENYLMFFGIESSLDKSLEVSTGYLREWLQYRYKLNLAQVSQVIGPAVQYRIPKVAANKVEVVAMIPKKILLQLGPVH